MSRTQTVSLREHWNDFIDSMLNKVDPSFKTTQLKNKIYNIHHYFCCHAASFDSGITFFFTP